MHVLSDNGYEVTLWNYINTTQLSKVLDSLQHSPGVADYMLNGLANMLADPVKVRRNMLLLINPVFIDVPAKRKRHPH